MAAIDSLLEAVPSDQQLSKIETLVDELSLKLREIEEQNGLDDSVFDIGSTEDNALCNSKVDTTEKVCIDPKKAFIFILTLKDKIFCELIINHSRSKKNVLFKNFRNQN